MWTEISQVIRDIVVTLGAGATAIAAWRGLSAWRGQMLGKERHRVAADLLRAAIKWREGVRRVRSPMMFAQEMEPFEDDIENRIVTDDENSRRSVRGYTRRWDALQEVRADLETAVVEAEMYLGDWARTWFSDLLGVEIDLRYAIEHKLSESTRRLKITPENDAEYRKQQAILYAGGSKDEFGARVEATVSDLRKLIDKHLK